MDVRADERFLERHAEEPDTLSIRYTTTSSPVGLVLVAENGRGVCAVMLGDAEEELATALRAGFPGALLERDDDGLAERAAQVVERASGGPGAEVPLDLGGTGFQRRVWAALREIPRGGTATYAEVARRIGMPSAARAVANACGANRVAIVVPCHRVVRTDGSLGGYRSGVERKKRLLEAERRG